jgi:hypothetical protein
MNTHQGSTHIFTQKLQYGKQYYMKSRRKFMEPLLLLCKSCNNLFDGVVWNKSAIEDMASYRLWGFYVLLFQGMGGNKDVFST